MLKELTDYLKTCQRATLILALANIGVFIWLTVTGSTEDVLFMLHHGACYTPLILEGEYYRLFTGMFLHFGLMHLIYNMLCLFTLGNLLEQEIGTVRFLVVYLAGGLAGNLASMAAELYFHRRQFAVSAGASGALFAVTGALFWLVLANRSGFFRRRRRIGAGLARIPVRRMGLMVLLMTAQGFMETGTDNAAHIGGLAGGFLIAAVLSFLPV